MLFWVSIISVLIWIYADMEFTKTSEVRISIRLTTGGTKDLQLMSPADHQVTFKIRGSRSGLDEFVRKYGNSTVTCNVSETLEPDKDETVLSQDILETIPEVRQLGLSILSGQPGAITGVRIERVEPHEIPVDFRYTGAELVKTPEARITIRVPSSLWRSIQNKGEPRIRTIAKDLKGFAPNKTHMVTFELVATIGGINVNLDKNSISTQIEIRQHTEIREVPISVRVLIPATWIDNGTWKEYEFKRKDSLEWLTKIKVTGPREDIEKLDPKSIDAYISLVEDDKKPVSWSTRKVVVHFPPHLQIRLADDQAEPTVQFRLEKRTTPGP